MPARAAEVDANRARVSEMGERKDLSGLLDCLGDPNGAFRSDAAKMLVELSAKGVWDDRVVQAIPTMFADPHFMVRAHACTLAHNLAVRIPRPTQLLDRLPMLLGDENEHVRSMAAHSLAVLIADEEGRNYFVPRIISALRSADARLREREILGLARLGNRQPFWRDARPIALPEALPVLAGLFLDPSPDVRIAVGKTLVEYAFNGVASGESFSAAMAAVKDPNEWVAAGAAEVVGISGSKIGLEETGMDALVSGLARQSTLVKRASAGAIMRLASRKTGYTKPISALTPILNDDDREVRASAAAAIGSILDHVEVPEGTFDFAFANLDSKERNVLAGALELIVHLTRHRITSKTCLAKFGRLISEPDPHIRSLAIRCIEEYAKQGVTDMSLVGPLRNIALRPRKDIRETRELAGAAIAGMWKAGARPDDSLRFFVDRIGKGDPDGSRSAAAVLASLVTHGIQDVRLIPDLILLSNDPDEKVAYEVGRSLKNMDRTPRESREVVSTLEVLATHDPETVRRGQ